ncbi:FUSC family protein [Patulibacter americanus]|uniref:FUSC family protein n=1 Tax=Patulibacter americanus TaxID=588672 RepID=UPI0003B5DCA4|nr:FUSC family protein [Patulibacter americanus]
MPASRPADRRPAAGRVAAALRALATAAGARRWVAVRAAVAVGLPLVLGLATGHVAEGGQAALGSFVAVYGGDLPYRRRAGLLALVGVALTVAMGLGTLVAGSVVLTCAVGAVLAIVSALGALALRVGPPREYFVILTFLLATTLPVDASAAPSRAALVLGGGVLAWLVAMVPWALRRPGPEGAATRRAHGAVAGLLAAVGTPRAQDAGHDAIVAVRAALETTDGATSADGLCWSRRVLAAELLLESALALEVEGSGPLDARWAAGLRALADGTAPGPFPDAPTLPAGPRLAHAAAVARDAWASDPVPRPGEPAELDPRWRAPLGWSLRRGSPHRRVALRIGLAVLAGLAVGHALGLDHPSWVAASAVAVLQGSSLTVARQRGAHRAVGTALGVVVAGAIFALDPSDAVKIALIVVLQLGIEAVIVASYGLAVTAITPLVLLLISVSGAGRTVEGLLDVRLVDTLVGCAVAAVLVLLTRPRASAGHLPDAQAEAIRAAAAVLVPMVTPGATRGGLLAGRRRVHDAIVRLRAAEADAVGDALRRDPRDDARWPLTSTVDRLARLALTVPATPETADGSVDPRLVDATLQDYAARAAGRVPDGSLPEPPRLPGLPRTTDTLAELHRRLDELAPVAG